MDDNIKQKKQLQTIGENLWFQSKMFFKSFDLSIFLQITLMVSPFILSLISITYDWYKTLDVISLFLWFLSVVYYLWYWQYTKLYSQRWEKYLILYKEVENYYRSNKTYNKNQINIFVKKQNELWELDKPNTHIFSKIWVDKTIENEMKYWNEKIIWWKQ